MTVSTHDNVVEDVPADPVPAPPFDVARSSILSRLTKPLGFLGAAVALPLLLYFVLRPENYSLTPNSLDPVFYTGYSINFDDILNSVGDRHYFVTRWSAYYPMYLADAIFGPVTGRLLWRLALAATMVVGLWLHGRRHRWTAAQQFLAATLVLTLPMFVRAFLTDYVEYMVVSLGFCLLLLCLREQQTWWSGAIIGALVALILVANPVAVVMTGFSLIAALVVCRGGVRGRLVLIASSSLAAIAVIIGGLVLFRWQYGIDDVYKPTIDFMRSYAGDSGAWKSPRYEWLAKFTWLYGPLILLAVAFGVGRRRQVRWHRTEVAALALCAVQYVNQWFEQFVRDGFGLELSFYWSFMYPSFAVALAIVVAKFTTASRRSTVVGIGIGWVLLLTIGIHPSLRLPGGVLFGLLAAAVVAMTTAVARRSATFGVAGLLTLLAWTQVGAPTYDPSAYFHLNVSPNYDRLFRHAGDESETILDEAIWFEEQMDRVQNDASTAFVVAGGWSSSITGLYAPHVTGRLVPLEPAGQFVSDVGIREIKAGGRPIVAVYGDPGRVATMVADMVSEVGHGQKLLDVTHDGGLHYRLVVVAMPDATRLPFTWQADALPIMNGHVEGATASVALPAPLGYVTFGPYVSMPVGSYSVTLEYQGSVGPGRTVGTFDVATLTGGQVTSMPLDGTAGQWSTVTLPFDVTDPLAVWEFRTNWAGVGRFTVSSITLTSIGP